MFAVASVFVPVAFKRIVWNYFTIRGTPLYIANFAAAIVFLEGGRYLGFPLTTLLASAGTGGLAIALSAQGTVKGLFGTVTVLLDRPYRVGERIMVKGHDGVVEEIGLRSTKIREFLTNHLISVPNDQMAESDIVNIRVIYWHVPPDLWSYYRRREQINLEICKAFEEQGIQFSLPVRHSYWKTDDAQGPLEVRLAESSDDSRK